MKIFRSIRGVGVTPFRGEFTVGPSAGQRAGARQTRQGWTGCVRERAGRQF